MRNWLSFNMLVLHAFVHSVRPASSLSWNTWTIFRWKTSPLEDPWLKQNRKRISHQAASDPHQDVLLENEPWFDINGTPLFYNAWRAKPGKLSPEPTARSKVLKYKARVACWPSSGGIWIKHAELVDLDFLDLSRFLDTPRQFNQTAEDEFCKRLQMVGAEWWRLPAPFEEREHLGEEQFACDTLEDCFVPDIKNYYLIAWQKIEEVACYVPITQAEKQGEARSLMYYNSRTMEERCDGIMGLGGKWCRCKDDCPALGYLDWGDLDRGDCI